MSYKAQFIGVVDDEFDLMCLYKEVISQIEGISVFGFTESPMALEHFRANQSYYALILSDFRIPAINGVELLKKVKDIKPSVKTLLMSAFDVGGELFQECDCDCVDKMLQKPIRMNALIEEVRMQIKWMPQQEEIRLTA